MKKHLHGIIAILIVFVMLIGSAVPAFSAGSAPKLVIDSTQAVKGQTVSVKLSVENNPGMAAATFRIVYDSSILQLDSVDFNTEFGGDFDELGSLALPVSGSDTLKAIQISWSSLSNISNNGTFLTMNFSVNKNSVKGDVADVSAVFSTGDFCNIDEEDVNFTAQNGKISVVEGIPGDINMDKVVNSKDLIRLRKYFGGFDVEVDIIACDCNGDGNVNSKDLMRLRKYFSGWDVELFYGPSVPVCSHSLTKTEATPATCTENGNIAYWYCSNCNKYFADENAATEITLEDTVKAAKGHTIVIDPEVPATYDHTGLTEGSHCSVCDKIIKAQDIIPKLEKNEYSITYHLSNGDEYLAQQAIENTNPAVYTSENGITRFNNPSVPGYQFLGWYDLPSGDAAENVKSIPVGTTGNMDLYARWEKISYKVNFSSDLIPVSSITYTVDEGAVLPSPKLDGYIFAGWSNDDGDVIKNIATGVTGSKTYKANWVSERNLAWSKTTLDDPMIFEDDETNTILFTYEIGEIRNVPLYVVEDFGKINSDGVTKTVTKEIQKTTSVTEMQKYTNTIAKATTNSFGMTLSNGWSDSTSISEDWCEENGLSIEEGETIAKSDTSGWYVSNGSYGTKTTVELDTKDNYDLHTSTKNTKTYNSTNTEKRQDFSADLNVEYKQPAGINAGVDLKYSNGKTTNKHTGKDKDKGFSDQTGSVSHTGTTTTHDGGWNNESGSSGSSTISNTTSLLQTVTQNISKKTGYGKSYIKTGNDTSTQDFSSTNSDTEEYSNTVTYSKEVSEKETVSYTTSNARAGYHRWIYAGTAHVFGVVGYDIATSSYFVHTISIMDDETHPYEDYSYSYASYDDNQSTYIKFEVPNDIEEYVASRVGRSDGLDINSEGVVTSYNGTDEYVVIPEYDVVDNLDGTTTVNKVVGFTDNAFKGNTKIYGVELSDFITEIPDYGFSGCTTLDTVVGNTITSVGTRAFANCSSLKVCGIGDDVTYLGDKAFENLDYMVVNASNNQVLNAATNSGAKKITIYAAVDSDPFENIEINIPNTCERFKFNGMGKTFNDVVIHSDAQETIINRATFNSTAKIPIVIDSPKVGLYQVTINSKGIGLALKNDNANVELYGPVSIQSEGPNSLLSKNFTLNKLESNFTSLLKTNHDILCCGKVTGNGLLNCGGSIVQISADEFEAQLKGVHNITFDANGGNSQLDNKTVYYGTQIGELPIPTRDYYTFDGWYTAADGGEEVTDDTVFTSVEDVTYYAHWTENPLSDWVKDSELPTDAKVEYTKYSYTQRLYTSSASSSMSGWTNYDTKRTDWGATQGPVYSDPNNGSRNVWSEQYVSSTTHHYVYYHRCNGSLWGTDSTAPGWARHQVDLTWALGNGYYSADYGIQFLGSYECPTCGAKNMWLYDYEYDENHYATRWYYQEPVYTYYYYKDENKESATYPSGENISNIQEWVQYRVK